MSGDGSEWTRYDATLNDGRKMACKVTGVFVADGVSVHGFEWGRMLAEDTLQGDDLSVLAGDDLIRRVLVRFIGAVLRFAPFAPELITETRWAIQALQGRPPKGVYDGGES